MSGSESQVRDFCLKLSISAGQIKSMRLKFVREHGKDKAEDELAKYLQAIWEETGDRVNLLRQSLPGGRPKVSPPFKRGSPKSGASRQEVPREAKPPRKRSRPVKPPSADEIKHAAQQSAYTDNPHLGVPHEPEAVSREYQDELSRRATQNIEVLRAEERRREKLRSVTGRFRNVFIQAGRRDISLDAEVEAIEGLISRCEQKVASLAA